MYISALLPGDASTAQLVSFANANRRIGEHVIRALNKIRRPSTAEEITEVVNRDLSAGDRPLKTREIAGWLRRSGDQVVPLYWLGNRPRR